MAEVEQTKICRRCAERIKTAARICPFCLGRQKGLPVGVWFMAISFSIMVISFGGGLIWFANGRWPLNPQKFSEHKSELKIVRASIIEGRKTPEGWNKSLPATKTNWMTHELEIRFVDEGGVLIDKQLPGGGYGVAYVVPSLWLTGFITNSGNYAWRTFELEAQFFNSKGNLVDVKNIRPYDSRIVAPHSETAFRLELHEPISTNANFKTMQIQIRNAVDDNSREN